MSGPADPIRSTTGSTGVDAVTQALALYRRTATSRSAIALLMANVIPLVGVVFFGWSLWTILVLYWLENGIVGFWNVPKILLAQGSVLPTLPDLPPDEALRATANPQQAATLRAAWQQARGPRLGSGSGVGRAVLAGFFCVHYGMFWLVHGIFIFALPLFLGASGDAGTCVPGQLDQVPTGIGPFGAGPFGLGGDVLQQCANAFGTINWTSVLLGGGALFLSHGASFLFNYIGRGEYLTASPGGQMAAPYARVVILHVTIIFGAFLVAFLGAPIGALLVLVVLKTAFDLGLHLRERRRADARVPADTAYGQAVRGLPIESPPPPDPAR